MERRAFLKRLGVVLGGLALAEAVPLGRVYSFPSNIVIAPEVALRFIRAFDVTTGGMITRVDMLYGLERAANALPLGLDTSVIFRGKFDACVHHMKSAPELKAFIDAGVPLELLRPNSKEPHLRGMSIPSRHRYAIHTEDAPYFPGTFAQVEGKENRLILLTETA